MPIDTWGQSFMASMAALWANIASFIPNLIAALLIVLLGFIVAKAVDTVLSKGLARLGLDRLMAGAGVTKMLGRVGMAMPVSALVGKILYWFIVLIYVVSES